MLTMATNTVRVIHLQSREVPVNDSLTKRGHAAPPNICGLNKLYETKLSKKRKCFWFITFITCFTLCCWQLSININRYLTYPLSTLIKLERFNIIYPPSITVCLHHMRFYNYVEAKAELHQNETVSNHEFEQYWKTNGIQPYQTTLSVSCDIFHQHFGEPCNWTDFSNEFANHKPVQTVIGQCVDINFKYFWKQRMTPIDLHVKAKENFLNETEYYNIFFHTPNVLYLERLYENIDLKYRMEGKMITFQIKQYTFLNTPIKPCQSVHNEIRCWQECLIKKIENVAGCKLPFMSLSNTLSCTTWNAAFKVIRTYEYFVETGKILECNCVRPCELFEYTVTTEVYDFHQLDHARVRFRIRDSFDEFIDEYYAYPLSSLIGDVSGVIGFFLGMTIVTFVEIIEYLGSFV